MELGVGPQLSGQAVQDPFMTLHFRLGHAPKDKVFAAAIPFGQARLKVRSGGRCEISGGTEADRAEILEWVSLCAQHLVPDESHREERSR